MSTEIVYEVGQKLLTPATSASSSDGAPSHARDAVTWNISDNGGGSVEEIDILAVHGLFGHRQKSWAFIDDQSKTRRTWLAELIPGCLPMPRVMSWGYNADPSVGTILTEDGFYANAVGVLEDLNKRRSANPDRPIMFICHGLGGLLIQKALVIASSVTRFRSILTSTRAVIFFSTPHKISDGQTWEDLVFRMLMSLLPEPALGSWVLTEAVALFRTVSTEYRFLSKPWATACIFEESTDQEPLPVIDEYTGTLGLYNEIRIGRKQGHRDSSKARENDDQLKFILKAIKEQVAGPEEYIECMRTLYRICPSNPLPVGLVGNFDIISTHSAFHAWIEADQSSMLIVEGPHGSGKKFLSHLAFQFLRQDYTKDHIVTFFSFDRQDMRLASEKSFLISVIRQILFLVPSVFRQTHKAYKLMTKNPHWIDDDVWTFFRAILRSLKVDTLFCVLNAVDDCKIYLKQALVAKLSTLTGFGNQMIKFLCTSTTRPELISTTKAHLTIDLEGLLKNEVKSFARRRALDLLREMPILESVKDDLHSRFMRCENYLQVDLLLEEIRNASSLSTPHALRNRLQFQEHNLKRAVIETLKQPISSWERTALSWLVHAARPLTPNELAVAVGMENFHTTILEMDDYIPRKIFRDLKVTLGPLVKMQNGEIRFVHRHVNEVLAHEGPKIVASDGLPLITGQLQIAKSCIKYISAKEVVQTARSSQCDVARSSALERGLSLVDYAITYWPLHYRQASKDQLQPEYILKTLSDQTFQETWSALLTERKSSLILENLRGSKPIHIATRLGFYDVVGLLLRSPSKEQLSPVDNALGLKLACEWGIAAIVQDWLENGVPDYSSIMSALEQPSAKGLHRVVELLIRKLRTKDTKNLGFPRVLLARAAQSGHLLTSELFIRSGANADATYQGSTPLHLAAAGGHENVVDLLLESNANVNAKDSSGSKPLHLACSNGYPLIVRKILKTGDVKDSLNQDGVSALHLAAENGDDISVQALLQAGVNPLTLSRAGITPLHLASANGKPQAVESLLRNGAEVNVLDDEGLTPLHHASELNDHTVAEILLENGADPNVVCASVSTPLIRATICGNLLLVQCMLERGANPSAQGKDGWAPIHHASFEGWMDIVSLLIEHKANIDLRNDDGSSPLHVAGGKGHEHIVKLLIKRTCDIMARNNAGKTALHDAAEFGKDSVATVLLDHGISIDEPDNEQRSALHYAVTAHNNPVARLLVERGADVNASDKYSDKPIAFAIRSGNTPAIRDLLKFKADPVPSNSDEDTLLQEAAFVGNINAMDILINEAKLDINGRSADGETALHRCWTSKEAAQWLLNNNADPKAVSRDGSSVLMAITRHGNIEIFNLLLHHGADIHAYNDEGHSALDLACRLGKLEIVKALLDVGVNPNSTDVEGNTPLNVAAEQGATTVVEALLDAGAGIDVLDQYQGTPLQYAASEKHIDTARVLLNRGAAVDLQDADGDTALSMAAYSGSVEVAEMLLSAGANLDAANKLGRTPLLVAAERSFKDMVSLLLDSGANLGAKTSNHRSALHLAVANRSKEILQLLLSSYPDLRCVDDQGRLAVHYAAQQGHEEHVIMLLKAGSPWQEADYQGRTLIHHAVTHYRVSELANLVSNVLKIRRSRPEPLNMPDHDGWTPLHWACKSGDARVVGLLLAAGAEPESQCRRGWTPRLIAAFHDRKDLVPYLWKTETREQSPTYSETQKHRRGSRTSNPGLLNRTSSFPVSVEEGGIEVGMRHIAATCDGCSTDIFGIRYHCVTCDNSQGKFPSNVNVCFKCVWNRESAFFSNHELEKYGSGPIEGPTSYWDGSERESSDGEDGSSSGTD